MRLRLPSDDLKAEGERIMRTLTVFLALIGAAVPLRAQALQQPIDLTLHHATASVGDLDRAIKWYQEKLGFKLQMRRRLNPDAEIAWMVGPGVRVDLIQRKGSAKPAGVKDHMLTQGWAHIVFAVADADKAYAILKARGVNLPEPVSVNPMLHIKTTHFPDSEGNWLELNQDLGTSPDK
jgi:catechol 2,3-dioxygenase-like lactoylglutathione lyase family enzyme